MKNILLTFLVFLAQIYFGQKIKEYNFNFNIKNFRTEYAKHKLKNPNTDFTITIPDINGNKIIYKISENRISQEPIKNIINFKGKSLDEKKTISLIASDKGISGSYLEGDKTFYIEPYKKKCKNHRLYYIIENPKTGQEKDFVQ